MFAGINGLHPSRMYWLKSKVSPGVNPGLHCGALVWFADASMPCAVGLPCIETHGHETGATLDRMLWFHRPVEADRWLPFIQEGTVDVGARALTWDAFLSENGALVAKAVQEALIRYSPPGLHSVSGNAAATGQAEGGQAKRGHAIE